MKIRSIIVLLFPLLIAFLVSACGTFIISTTPTTTSTTSKLENITPVAQARENVISKWTNESDEFGTPKYIEDIYKQYPDDDVISNIYFYCIAKQQYDNYVSLDNEDYLDTAREYAANIDPNYAGEFSEEIHLFAEKLLESSNNSDDRDETYSKAKIFTNNYNNLTNSDKKEICDYIQSRYDYYDSISGGYAGDKYTDTIWKEVAEKYNLTESQIDIIWMNMYEY